MYLFFPLVVISEAKNVQYEENQINKEHKSYFHFVRLLHSVRHFSRYHTHQPFSRARI